MRKFEAHITCPRESGDIVQAQALPGWVFSAIDGDPLLGKRPYCYLTGYDTDSPRGLLADMRLMAHLLRESGVEVLREKVEEIIYDTKTGHNQMDACCGRCGEP